MQYSSDGSRDLGSRRGRSGEDCSVGQRYRHYGQNASDVCDLVKRRIGSRSGDQWLEEVKIDLNERVKRLVAKCYKLDV